ncbi:MAG: hypothetical protein ABI775_04220 [Pseudonocardiales bacterium]
MAFAPDPVRSAGQHRATKGARSADRGHRRYRVLVLTLLVSVVAITAGASLTLRAHRRAAPLERAAQVRSPTPPLVQAAEAWLSTNLPRSATLVADATVRAELIDSGFPAAAVTLPGQVTGCDALSFVVVTRALESTATKDATLTGCVRSALPVAVFGSGAAAVRIAETVPAGSRALAAQRSGDAYDRKLAGTALARNPSVHTSAALNASLNAGTLDLRAATVIAVLAARTQVRVAALLGDPAELAAGLPARTVHVALADTAELAAVLATLSEPFRPSAVVRIGSDGFRLTWLFATTPVPGLK